MDKNIVKLIKLGINKVKTNILTRLSIYSQKNFTTPIQVYWNMSNKCNFRCGMCPQWHRGEIENHDSYCNFDHLKKVIDEMVQLKIANLGLTGGEPLMNQELLFAVLEYANSKGIYTHFGSNGWLLTDKILSKYDLIGGGHISLSIDGIGSTHDKIRNFPGAFNKIISVLEVYNNLHLKNTSIKINTVFSNQNYKQILDIIKLAKKYNSSIFIQPFDNFDYDKSNQCKSLIDEKFEILPENFQEIREIVDEIIKIKKSNKGLILNSAEHLKNIPDYFLNRFQFHKKCEVVYNNLSIDPFGNVIPCAHLGVIGNIKNSSIYEIWNSDKAKIARDKSRMCRQNCMQGCFLNLKLMELLGSGSYYITKLVRRKFKVRDL